MVLRRHLRAAGVELLIFAAVALVGMFFKSEGVQKTIAVVSAILVTTYVAILFSTLH